MAAGTHKWSDCLAGKIHPELFAEFEARAKAVSAEIFRVKTAGKAQKAIEGLVRTIGAEIVAVACSGCMVQIPGDLDKQAPGIKMRHVADILAEAIEYGLKRISFPLPLEPSNPWTLSLKG